MSSITSIAIAGSPGSGKTTWIRQFLSNQDRPLFYCCCCDSGNGNRLGKILDSVPRPPSLDDILIELTGDAYGQVSANSRCGLRWG